VHYVNPGFHTKSLNYTKLLKTHIVTRITVMTQQQTERWTNKQHDKSSF